MQPETSRDTIPITKFDLEDLPEHERFAAWQESIACLFDVTLDPAIPPNHFSGLITACHLGSLILANARIPKQCFNRRRKLIAQDGIDHFLVQVFRQGRNVGQLETSNLEAQPGDVALLDLGQPFKTHTETQDSLSLVIPRPMLEQRLKSAERFHGQVLPRQSPLGQLLGEHLHTLWQVSQATNLEQANIIAESAVALVASYFGQSPFSDLPQHETALGLSIRRYIAGNFQDRTLGPDTLVTSFRISRAQLYRMFKPHGGVARYIQDQRLNWCFKELAAPANRRRRVSEVAYMAGFADEAHFSRLFRRTFGLSPSEVRPHLLGGARMPQSAPGLVDRTYEDWLYTLGRVERPSKDPQPISMEPGPATT